MDYAIVIGIDEYGSDSLRLSGAVPDAIRFRDWLIAEGRGNVPPENVRLLLGRSADDPDRSGDDVVPTKDAIVTAINEMVGAAAGGANRLFFFFSGHGITARVANRDESALVTPGFDEIHPDHSLAVRSLTEYFETTPFRDQFFFLDACRNMPWEEREFEIGRWPIPRKRDPLQPPVQQFILQATSPGLTAAELGWFENASGAFTDVLMEGLAGAGSAKAWSWERNCYEIRWERLARYINAVMSERKLATKLPPGAPAGDPPIQIPQDSGARGVAGRDRDALLASFPSGHFGLHALTVELEADPEYDEAEVSVLDALGEPVASALKLTGTSHTFRLAPKTYAVRAATTAPEERFGTLRAPIELYSDDMTTIPLVPRTTAPAGEVSERLDASEIAAAGRERPPGTMRIRSVDPLSVAEIRDESGRVFALARAGERQEAKPGFYRISDAGPEASYKEQFVVLSAGDDYEAVLRTPRPASFVAKLAEALGGEAGDDHVRPVAGAEPAAWARPSTIVAAAVGAALHGDGVALAGLGLTDAGASLGDGRPGVALFAVAGEDEAPALTTLSARIWRAGDPVPGEPTRLQPSPAGVAAAVVARPGRAEPHWLSVEPEGADPTVVALPVLPGRLATIVAEVGPDRVRLYQFHPVAGPHRCSTADWLRRQEHLQRRLLAGRLDGARGVAEELAATAPDDPFAACLAGYALFRLGGVEPLDALVSAIVETAAGLCDAYVLRGVLEASRGRSEAATQAFASAVNAGVPAFGEGLTRLVEGLAASAFGHPRGALVRYIFQRHARGTMWSAFTPARGLEPGRLVISGHDLGYEG